MKKILVIGGNGFVGKNIVKHLVAREYSVFVYDMNAGNEKNVTYYIGNVTDDPYYEKILCQADVIIYLISAIMPKQSMEEPLSSYCTDIPLLVKTLELCRKNDIKRIIYSSSGGTVYGDSEIANIEEKLTNPINHYAICKLACEKILCLYNLLYDMENVVLRIANPYGNGQRLESGVGAITTFTRLMLNGESIKIYGDGQNIRDYIDVEEVAKIFALATEWEYDKSIMPIFNVGTGIGYSLLQIIDIISEELGLEPTVEFLSGREFDVHCNILDMNKTQKVLGFKHMTSVESHIRRYIKKLASEKK